jgi:DNA repair exonuclease SbcCD ATPase subunit
VRLEALEVENFKAIGRVEYELPCDPVLVFVNGINYDDGALGSNGAGKSTVFADVPSWVLTGKTIRGARRPNPDYDITLDVAGTLVFKGFGEVRRVSRLRGKNSLTLDGREVTQDDLNEALGVPDASVITQAFIGSQYDAPFLGLKPAVQTAALSKLMRLEFWRDLHTKASDQRRSHNKRLPLLDMAFSQAKLRLKDLKAREIRDDFQKWEKTRAGKIRTLRSELKQLGVDWRGYKRRLEAALDAVGNLIDRVSKREDQLREKSTTQAAIKSSDSIRQDSQNRLKGKREQLSDTYDDLSDLTHCPTCNQALTGSEVLKTLSKAIDGRTQEIEVIQEERDTLAEALSVADQDVITFTHRLRKDRTKLRDAEENVRALTRERRQKSDAHDASEKELEALRAEVNPLEAQIQKLDLSTDVAESQVRLASRAHMYGTLEFNASVGLVESIATSRVKALEQGLNVLSAESDLVLESLGMGRYEARFMAEQEDGKGEQITKFMLGVFDRNTDVKIEELSGGEFTRAALAVELALMNMAQSASSFHTGMEVWDEPTRWVSDAGIAALWECLADRARALKHPIFLIDHRDEKDIPGDAKIVTVEKRNGEIRLR